MSLPCVGDVTPGQHNDGGEHQERNITAELLRFNCLSRYFSEQVLCSTFCNQFIGRFLTSYGASQAKHQNGQKGRTNEFQNICLYIYYFAHLVHYKHEYVRACLARRGDFPSSETLGFPSDATRVDFLLLLSFLRNLQSYFIA